MRKSIILLLVLILISPFMIRAYTDSNQNITTENKIEEVYYAEASAYSEDPFSKKITNPKTSATTIFGTILGVVLISALIIIPKKFIN